MGVRTWLLRRAMGRLRISDDIVRHLSTFQRLGETVEVQLPTEVLPVGARTVLRALRTRAAAQLGPDWVWPFWLERQIDPRSSAFVPRGHLPFLANITNRNWTMVGNVGSPWEAIVDERGLVTPWFDGWSLDWWVGADDRWHFPSREVSVRQRLVDAAPVVETAMRVPGGDAVQRVYAVQGAEELAVVEFENASNLPFALALAVRPYNPEGLAVVERIQLVDGTVTVDGRPAMLFPSEPARVAGSTFHGGDSMRIVTDGRAGTSLPELRCEAGLAQAAFLFPLAHRATLRVAVPLVSERRTRRRRLARRRVERMPELPSALPSSISVARAWQAQTRRGMQLELPDPALADAVEANRRYMLLFHDGTDITPGPSTYHRFWFRDAAYMLAAMGRFGRHSEVAEVLCSYPGRQHVDGYYFSQRQEWDSNGAAIWALAEHWRLTRDEAVLRSTIQSVSRGVRWIERKRHSKRRARVLPWRRLLPEHRPHRAGHIPHDAAGVRRARAGRPPRPRPAALVAVRRHLDVHVARGHPSPTRRGLHGRRAPRLGGRRLPVSRTQPVGTRSRRGPDDALASARRLGGPVAPRARRPYSFRAPVLCRALAWAASRPPVGAKAPPRCRARHPHGTRSRSRVVEH